MTSTYPNLALGDRNYSMETKSVLVQNVPVRTWQSITQTAPLDRVHGDEMRGPNNQDISIEFIGVMNGGFLLMETKKVQIT